MGKAAKGGKGKSSAKEDRKAKKAAANREREGSRRRRGGQHLDRSQLATFSRTLHASGLELNEVARDGNCFYRSLSDQLDHTEVHHMAYRQRVVAYMKEHADDYVPFLTFGEGDEEDDADFDAYTARMSNDGEWAGQPELLAAAHALRVHIIVHQWDAPAYRIESSAASQAKEIHVSYHDGEHYNSVRVLGAAPSAAAPAAAPASADENSLMASSGCTDVAAARRALDKSGGDLDAALERLQLDAMDGGDGDGSGGDGGGGADDATGGAAAAADDADGAAADDDDDGSTTLKARREKKATRKEEKRAAKEQRHREAARERAAAAADDDDGAAAPAAGPIDRGGVITL